MSVETRYKCQQTLRKEFRSVMNAVRLVSRFVDTDSLRCTKDTYINHLDYADGDQRMTRLCDNSVMIIWKRAAEDIVDSLRRATFLRLCRLFWLDRILGCGSSRKLYCDLCRSLDELVNPNIRLEHGECKKSYVTVISRAKEFHKLVRERRIRFVVVLAALCSITGLTLRYLMVMLYSLVSMLWVNIAGSS